MMIYLPYSIISLVGTFGDTCHCCCIIGFFPLSNLEIDILVHDLSMALVLDKTHLDTLFQIPKDHLFKCRSNSQLASGIVDNIGKSRVDDTKTGSRFVPKISFDHGEGVGVARSRSLFKEALPQLFL